MLFERWKKMWKWWKNDFFFSFGGGKEDGKGGRKGVFHKEERGRERENKKRRPIWHKKSPNSQQLTPDLTQKFAQSPTKRCPIWHSKSLKSLAAPGLLRGL